MLLFQAKGVGVCTVSLEAYENQEQDEYISVLEFVNHLYKRARPQIPLKKILGYLGKKDAFKGLTLYEKHSYDYFLVQSIGLLNLETSTEVIQSLYDCLDCTQIGISFLDEEMKPFKRFYFKFSDASKLYEYVGFNPPEIEINNPKVSKPDDNVISSLGGYQRLLINYKLLTHEQIVCLMTNQNPACIIQNDKYNVYWDMVNTALDASELTPINEKEQIKAEQVKTWLAKCGFIYQKFNDRLINEANNSDQAAIEHEKRIAGLEQQLSNKGADASFMIGSPTVEQGESKESEQIISDLRDKKSTAVMSNSLASYMTEYTLPQIVALILHIDLADITTNSSNSYIHDQGKYSESSYSKFDNLLQSYSVAALNNKLDGVDLYTRTVTTYGDGTETHVDLEKTSISRSNLASFLSSIGCQLDDLITKQAPIHEGESEQVLSLKQQITELQEQLITKENAELSVNNRIESAEPKQKDKVSEHTIKELVKENKQLAVDLNDALDEINKLKSVSEKTEPHINDHILEFDWCKVDRAIYPPELHLALTIWHQMYVDNTTQNAYHNSHNSRFEVAAKSLGLKPKSSLGGRLNTVTNPVKSKMEQYILAKQLYDIKTLNMPALLTKKPK